MTAYWSEKETQILRLLIRRMREENWRTARLLHEAARALPQRTAEAVKRKKAQMIHRREV